MGLDGRLSRGAFAFKSTFYLEVIGGDILKVVETRLKKPDDRAVQKRLKKLVDDLRQQTAIVLEISKTIERPEMVELHDHLFSAASECLTRPTQGGWEALFRSMSNWAERYRDLDLRNNPNGGRVTKALDLLWKYPDGRVAEPTESGSQTSNNQLLSDYYISLRLAQIEEKPMLRRPRIPLGPI